LVVTNGNKDFSITLETPFPTSEKSVQALLSAARQQSFMLRRRTLLAFINAKPAQRYEAIEEFLRLEKFNTFEEKLKSLFSRSQASLLVATNERDTNEAAIRLQLQLTPFSAFDEAACLKQVNSILQKANANPIAKLDEAAGRAQEIDLLLAPFTKMDERQKIHALKLLVQETPSASGIDFFKTCVTVCRWLSHFACEVITHLTRYGQAFCRKQKRMQPSMLKLKPISKKSTSCDDYGILLALIITNGQAF